MRLVLSLVILLVTFNAAEAADSLATLLSRKPPVATTKLAYGSEPDQFGELWMPDGKGPYPVIVIIHGGCWQESIPGVVMTSYIAEDLREEGYAVWNIEYRRLGAKGGGYPGTFLDVENAIDYLRQIKSTYNLDLTSPLLIGHSAGGHLALWAAGRAKLKASSPLYRANPLAFSKVASLGGIEDLRAFREEGDACGGPSAIDELTGVAVKAGSDPYADTSPAAMLPLKVPQVIVIGKNDSNIMANLGTNYTAAAKAAGDNVQLFAIDNATHFDLIDPRTDAWRQIKVDIGIRR